MPLWNCTGCGAETNRSTQVFYPGGVEEKCPACGMDKEKLSDPSDTKLWHGEQFDPKGYEMRDGKKVLTEERQADIIEELAAPDGEEERKYRAKVEWKRATRRTTPSTRAEIEMIDRLVRDKIRTEQARANAEDAGLFLPN